MRAQTERGGPAGTAVEADFTGVVEGCGSRLAALAASSTVSPVFISIPSRV